MGTGLFADPLRRQMLEMGNQKRARLWSLEAWPGARPLDLRRGGIWEGAGHAFHPEGEWVVMSTHGASRLTFWPLRAATPWVVDGYIARARAAVFTPDSALLATWWPDNRYRLWPLPGSHAKEPGELSVPIGAIGAINCVDSRGRYLVGGGFAGAFWLVPLDGSPPRELGDFSGDTIAQGCTVSPSGNLVVAAPQFGEDRTLRVWDVESEDERVFGLAVHGFVGQLSFADESTLFTTGDEGIHRWDLETGNHELVYAVDEDKEEVVSIAPGARRALLQREPTQGESSEETADFALLDLVTGEIRELSWSGGGYRTRFPAWDPSGEVVAFGDETGLIRVGKISARSPHLLIGHEGAVQGVRISPDGRWLASTGEDNTLRLWPMPDLDKPPLHILPHDLLIAKLKSLTNIRVVRDPDAPDGWLEALDPFPGWGEVPEW